ncbi:DUF4256 domain-containing protein [Shouchella lehensis]|uniref:DUF4256 domain-containing protein n=1 Tax=Shouchella lehensis TaxID=300825 RepID=A0A4Y7WL70_9BACI|nr:DUF4256 domain-containing protein [Shouchella lehensis]MBG9783303.1 hypothetical protein [Shouchella lehensis]TES49318.1 DUF4256 domain-containing protein [Shouchella lehensis]
MTYMENHFLSDKDGQALLSTLENRFKANQQRHPSIEWTTVKERLKNHPEALWSLNEMEMTGGEPDVVFYDAKQDLYTFVDCSRESPIGRRSACYDQAALDARKANKPALNVIDTVKAMGTSLLTEAQYRALQELGEFDAKTSSWVQTPADIRKRGGALFCDYRFGHVFVYHNGASSYYSARGFRVALTI